MNSQGAGTQQLIDLYIEGLPAARVVDFRQLCNSISQIAPDASRWFFDGKNEDGKVVSNPSVGFGHSTLSYADGSNKPFYRVGISANTSGLSVYFFGLPDKNLLKEKYGAELGKASVSGYCIKFRSLKHIELDVLLRAISDAFRLS